MSVIDGMHRLSAAIMANRTEINAVFFHGTSAEAFRLGVAANVSHGLPLTLAERRSAAIRIVKSQPGLSDRAVAETTGLSSKTVAVIRQQVQVPSEPVRLGRDGRLRPMSTAEGRITASRLMADNPHASLREVAQAAGVSVGTARDVRHRLRTGRDPVPERQQANGDGKANNERTKPRPRGEDNTDALLVFECLQRDPSLRYSEAGRRLLRDLRHRMVTTPHLRRWLEDLPPHTTVSIAKIARTCERAWSEFAEQLEQTTLG
jgi:transposase